MVLTQGWNEVDHDSLTMTDLFTDLHHPSNHPQITSICHNESILFCTSFFLPELRTIRAFSILTVNSFLLLTDFMGIERLLQFIQVQFHGKTATCTSMSNHNFVNQSAAAWQSVKSRAPPIAFYVRSRDFMGIERLLQFIQMQFHGKTATCTSMSKLIKVSECVF